MSTIATFVQEHLDDDVTRLILDRNKWPEIDMDLVVSCIECRRKLKGKVNEWYDNPELIFPIRLSAEQCSSSATGRYKADLIERIEERTDRRLADLTGGLGVDSWFFSRNAGKVLYNEMQEKLCSAAIHNFKVLGADNIQVSNLITSSETISPMLESFRPDIVYMDPARRGEGGRKVFLIEECTPDILTLKDAVFHHCRHMLLKLSPMADINMVCERLGTTCREVHIVAAGGECKELLIWMDREWKEEYSIIAIELPHDYPAASPASFSFRISEEKSCAPVIAEEARQQYLFEPGKALMKSGAFNLACTRFGLEKLGRSTHYYLTDSVNDLKKYGKIYRILNVTGLDKRSMKEAGKQYPRSEVTARNIAMDSETLRKKTGVTSGDDAHIFGLKSDKAGNLLFITQREF